MKRNISFFTMVGVAIFVALSLIDRFLVAVPNVIYIPLAILSALALVVGITINRTRAKANSEQVQGKK